MCVFLSTISHMQKKMRGSWDMIPHHSQLPYCAFPSNKKIPGYVHSSEILQGRFQTTEIKYHDKAGCNLSAGGGPHLLFVKTQPLWSTVKWSTVKGRAPVQPCTTIWIRKLTLSFEPQTSFRFPQLPNSGLYSKGSSPKLCVVFSCYVSLVAFNMSQCLNICLTFVILMLLKITGQQFCPLIGVCGGHTPRGPAVILLSWCSHPCGVPSHPESEVTHVASRTVKKWWYVSRGWVIKGIAASAFVSCIARSGRSQPLHHEDTQVAL